MEVATLPTITTSMEVAQVAQQHVPTMVAERPLTTTTNMVAVRVAQQPVLTMVEAQLPTIMTSMVAVRAVQQLVLTTVAVQLRTTTISMVEALVRRLPDRIMAVEPLQPTTTSTAIASVPVPAGE